MELLLSCSWGNQWGGWDAWGGQGSPLLLSHIVLPGCAPDMA